jgi:hypothetical protein
VTIRDEAGCSGTSAGIGCVRAGRDHPDPDLGVHHRRARSLGGTRPGPHADLDDDHLRHRRLVRRRRCRGGDLRGRAGHRPITGPDAYRPPSGQKKIRNVFGSPAKRAYEREDVAEQLRKLGELHDEGVISDEEFERKKAELLARL